MATHASVLAWRIPGMVEPGGLPSTGSHKVGHERLSCGNSNQSYCSRKYNLFSELFLNMHFIYYCLLNRNPVRIGAKVRVVIPVAHRRKRSSRSNDLWQPVTPN